MITQELKQQILSLSSDEQYEIVQLIQEKTNLWAGITNTPRVVGGDACIRDMRIPVWSLVEYRQMGANDDKILEAYPQLTAVDLANAWAYAETFSNEIAQAIAANQYASKINLYADENRSRVN